MPSFLLFRLPQMLRRRYATRCIPAATTQDRFRSTCPSQSVAEDNSYHQAELFYLQKQIQSQTPMVIVLEDGEHVKAASSGTTATVSKSAVAPRLSSTSPRSSICTSWANKANQILSFPPRSGLSRDGLLGWLPAAFTSRSRMAAPSPSAGGMGQRITEHPRASRLRKPA